MLPLEKSKKKKKIKILLSFFPPPPLPLNSPKLSLILLTRYCSLFSTSLLPEDTPVQMSRLREFLDCSILDPEERKDYLFAWSGLQSACNNLRYSEPHTETSMAFFWPFILPTRVMTDLQREKPLSLVLLAHYCVLLRSLEYFWFAKGWAKPVLTEIVERLEPDLVTWLTWPNKHVFNRD